MTENKITVFQIIKVAFYLDRFKLLEKMIRNKLERYSYSQKV